MAPVFQRAAARVRRQARLGWSIVYVSLVIAGACGALWSILTEHEPVGIAIATQCGGYLLAGGGLACAFAQLTGRWKIERLGIPVLGMGSLIYAMIILFATGSPRLAGAVFAFYIIATEGALTVRNAQLDEGADLAIYLRQRRRAATPPRKVR